MMETKKNVAIKAEQLSGKRSVVNGEEFRVFTNQIRGDIVTPSDDNYDDSRSIYNAMIDKKPALIVYCANVADVISCVHVARKHQLLTAVRGGGHNGPGLSLADGGLVIDLSRMKGIRVDPEAETVRAEAGCTWADVDHATNTLGFA